MDEFIFGCESKHVDDHNGHNPKKHNNKQYLPNYLPNHYVNNAQSMFDQNLKSDIENNQNKTQKQNILYKDHLADLLISCDGSCGFELALILHCCKHVIESGNYSQYPTECKLCTKAQTCIDYAQVIENYFFNYDDPHRQCLIINFEKFGCIANDDDKNGFKLMYNQLNDNNNHIFGQAKAKMLVSFFYNLLYFNFDAILNKLANLGCRRNAVTLREEIKNGIGSDHPYLNGKHLSNIIEKISNCKTHLKMIKYGKKLTNDEIMSLYLYTAIDQLSGKFRESHRAQQTCKFKKLFENVTRAVLKIHQTFYCNSNINNDNINNINHNIPQTLYHGISVPMKLDEDGNNQYQWSFQTITSFTRDRDIAIGFGQKNNNGNSITLLKIENVEEKIKNQQLIAVDISWISEWSKEDEWVVLPIQLFSDKNHFGSKKYEKLENKTLNLHVITQCKPHNIEYILDTDSENKLPLLAKYIPQLLLEPIHRVLVTFVYVLGLFYRHKCDHCHVASHCVLWNGNLLYNTAECPACRRINFGAFQRRNTKVECYSCKNKYFRDQFIDSAPNIGICKQCTKLKILCQECKNKGKLCPNKLCLASQVEAKKHYVLNDKEFEKKLKNKILPIVEDTIAKYGLVFEKRGKPICVQSESYLAILEYCLKDPNITLISLAKFMCLDTNILTRPGFNEVFKQFAMWLAAKLFTSNSNYHNPTQ